MNVRLHNTTRCELPVSIRHYKTVRVAKAIIPMTYYNVSADLHNNYIRYALMKNDVVVSQDSLVIPDGMYSLQSYNEAIQKELKKADLDNAIEIIYLQDRGLLKIQLNNENFAPFFHKSLGEFLGINYGTKYMRKTITGIKPCKFSPHHEYRISCNLVDTAKNLLSTVSSGCERSDIITSFVPKGKFYGDIHEYVSKEKVKINQYDYSYIEISIKNHEDKDIVFNTPFIINLLLE